MSERSPLCTPEGEENINSAANGQTTQSNVKTQGTEDNDDGSKDGKTEDKFHENRNDFSGPR